ASVETCRRLFCVWLRTDRASIDQAAREIAKRWPDAHIRRVRILFAWWRPARSKPTQKVAERNTSPDLAAAGRQLSERESRLCVAYCCADRIFHISLISQIDRTKLTGVVLDQSRAARGENCVTCRSHRPELRR